MQVCLLRAVWFGVLVGAMVSLARGGVACADDVLPELVTTKSVSSVQKGLDYLKNQQQSDGSLGGTTGTAAYPMAMNALAGMAFLASGNTTTRGPYAEQVRGISSWIAEHVQPNGLLAAGGENGQPMHGHGFALMFLGCVYGMEADPDRRKKIGEAIEAAIKLTNGGQSSEGGWSYQPSQGDEGSVTVTQLQGLRAAHSAGFDVSEDVVSDAIRYLEKCETPDGGICYSLGSGGGTRPAITAAAICCLYSSGEYDSPLAESCLEYTIAHFRKNGVNGFGHDFYANLYASQAFYQAGDKYWNDYFPKMRDRLTSTQAADGSWQGDGVGPVYGTAIGCIILQLPYRYLPIYQR